jgi:hypothetical protein
VPGENPLARTALGDPDCSQPGRNRQRSLSKCLAQKYPNSFSQNTEERRACAISSTSLTENTRHGWHYRNALATIGNRSWTVNRP